MRTGEEGKRLIKNYEGCRLKAYKPVPTEQMYTIGWGHYGVKKDTVWTQQQADDQFVKDLVKYENYVNNLGRNWTQNQFDALVSFTYNCGPGNLASLCRNRNPQQIADAFLLYNKAGYKVLEGLTKRRKQERELFLKPSTPNSQGLTLPYKVKTTCDLNIREGAGTKYNKIRMAKKGEILTVWAIETNGDTKWGKNGREFFALNYCEVI